MADSKKRDAIIRATIELAAEKGITGASTALIAERAQTAEVTIFRQFKTKEALLHTIFAEQMERIRQTLMKDHDKTMPHNPDPFYSLLFNVCPSRGGWGTPYSGGGK